MAVVFVLFAWVGGLVAGAAIIMDYQFTPGARPLEVRVWPVKASHTLSILLPTLILFAHPECPCSDASLDELASLVASHPGRIQSIVYFYKPSTFPNNWEKTKLWFKAARIPGATVVLDVDGVQAQIFHAVTSGATYLFSPNGMTVFQGGITKGRGQRGLNPGLVAIESYLSDGKEERREARTYGCSLFKKTSEITP